MLCHVLFFCFRHKIRVSLGIFVLLTTELFADLALSVFIDGKLKIGYALLSFGLCVKSVAILLILNNADMH